MMKRYMVKQEYIITAIKTIEQNYIELYKYKNIKAGELVKDKSLQWTIERGLQITIQAILDIGSHILSDYRANGWKTYKEIPLKLYEHGIITKSLAKKIALMAGLRNILVHEYIEVDTKKIEEILRFNLEDFKKFVIQIRK
ncbi:MAG: DUF86 domain-containing protein, partial [Bacteroidetes bacterium]|nr:DUF86 domain-containing protein [Bacteroidota bacterium]